MPHYITNRPRYYMLARGRITDRSPSRGEFVNTVLYITGGIAFTAGSAFFLPQYERLVAVGVWIYFWGSIVYAIVTIQDLLECINNLKQQNKVTRGHVIDVVAAAIYLIGTLLFIVGSYLFLPSVESIEVGAWCFIVGSVLFLIGSCMNVLQIVKASSLLRLQLLNATAVCFVTGSTLFIVGSIPFLWRTEGLQIEDNLFAYVAWEYIVGSLLFLAGGLFNYYREFKTTKY